MKKIITFISALMLAFTLVAYPKATIQAEEPTVSSEETDTKKSEEVGESELEGMDGSYLEETTNDVQENETEETKDEVQEEVVVEDIPLAKSGSVSSGWTQLESCEWKIDSNGTLTIRPLGNGSEGYLPNYNGTSWPWGNNTSVKKMVISGTVHTPVLMDYFCKGLSNLTTVDFSGFAWSTKKDLGNNSYTTYKTQYLSNMFNGCTSLTTVDMSSWDTSEVRGFSSMFYNCENLVSVNTTGVDTSKAVYLSSMFRNCTNLTSVDVSKFNTSNVTDMSFMFSYCENLKTINVSNFNLSNATDISKMFNGCSSLTSIDVSKWNTSKVTDFSNLFSGTSVTNLNLSNFDTSNATDIGAMFNGCEELKSLNISSFNTSKVTNMRGMFYGCWQLESLDVSKFDTSNVTSMSMMFYDCENLTSLNVKNFNTSKVENMYSMFGWCIGVSELDLSSFDTTNVTNMTDMFLNCEYDDVLEKITLGSKFKFLKDDEGLQQPQFPEPSGGKWKSSKDGKLYSIGEIPSNVAATYTAQRNNVKTQLQYNMFTVDTKKEAYTGSPITKKITSTLNSSDYTVTYKDNTDSGIATITIQATENSNYSGSLKYEFRILGIGMYRLYNPNSGEHFYTADASERDRVVKAGWNYEGIGWIAPSKTSIPVYRLYSGTDHHYTMDKTERDNLIKVGWKDEGIGWYSDDSKSVPLYRQFNPYVEPTAPTNNSGSHNYTTNSEERDTLVKVGWRDEGIAWYGMYDYSQDDD